MTSTWRRCSAPREAASLSIAARWRISATRRSGTARWSRCCRRTSGRRTFPGLIGGLLVRPASARDAWEFVKANWDALQKTGVFQGLPAIVDSTGAFCDQPLRDDVQRFFEAHPARALTRNIQQSLETIDRCIRTKNQQGQNLTAYLR